MPVTLLNPHEGGKHQNARNSELSEKETTITTSQISAAEVQSSNTVEKVQSIRLEKAIQVHNRGKKMTNMATLVIEPELNGRIQRMESFIGKYENASLIDIDFIDSYQFSAMKR